MPTKYLHVQFTLEEFQNPNRQYVKMPPPFPLSLSPLLASSFEFEPILLLANLQTVSGKSPKIKPETDYRFLEFKSFFVTWNPLQNSIME